ncbi:MAG: amino acid decarboxylase [Solirubrobacteraceae bacterium]
MNPDLEQSTAPYLDALASYGFREPTLFGVPGHKGGAGADPALRNNIGGDALLMDVPRDTRGVDVPPPFPTPFDQAEMLAADLYGSGRTWFLSNGATQGNHAMVLAQAPLGATVVAQRNSHGSIVDGLVLSGGRPYWVSPAYEPELGMAHGVLPEDLDAALTAAPDARTAFVVSPTYYGMAADIGALAEVAHAHDAALAVDQSWGPHFGFHRGVPPSALQEGADAVLTSTHKIVGSLTQSAMLHVADGGRINPARVNRTLRLVSSTSPSSLLLASLDSARRQLAIHGQDLLGRTLAAAERARAGIDAIEGCHVVGEELVGTPGVAAWDPLRIVIDVRGTGCTGYEISDQLRKSSDVHVELATHATLVLVLGISQPVDALDRFAHDLEAELREIRRPEPVQAIAHPPAALNAHAAVPPREAFLGLAETVDVDASVGRISSEAIAGYPPGIPAILPGERVTEEVIEYLRELARSGARLHGASDPTFRTIAVLRDEPA